MHGGVWEVARRDRQERRSNQEGREIAKTSREGVWAIGAASFLLMRCRTRSINSLFLGFTRRTTVRFT